MLLQKILILLMLGLAALFCAVGCDEDASVQAGKNGPIARPVNNQPDKAAPLPAGATTQSASTPATQPAVLSKKPVAIHAPSVSPDADTAAKNIAHDNKLTPKQVQLYDSLRQQSLKLQMKLDELQERNEKLTRALVDSRESGQTLQDNLQRSTIVQEIQSRELLDLKERLGQTAAKPSTDTSTTNPTPVEAGQAATRSDPVHLNLEIARLRRTNEKLQLQLQLAKLDTPDARQKVLVKLGESVEQNEKLERINRELSHMVVSQSDQIRNLQKRQEELDHLQADHAEQIARMDRQARKELATMEIQLVESRKRITTLKNDIAQRDYQIRTLNGQLASAKATPPAPTVAAVPVSETAPQAVVSRPVLIKTVPVDSTPAKPEPAVAWHPTPENTPKSVAVIAQTPAPKAAPKPAPVEASSTTPTKAVVAPPAVSASVGEPIAGKIAAINGLMVMVNVGKDFGVEEGMRLIAYRQDKFVGYLHVEQVGRWESVCTFSRQILPPQVGDHVVDRLE